MVHRAHQVDQFLVDDADKLVRGVERLEDRLADGLLRDLGDERLGDLDADVGLQQGRLHQGQPFAHVRLGQPAASAEGPDRRTEVFLKGFEHGYPAPIAWGHSKRVAASSRGIPYLTEFPPGLAILVERNLVRCPVFFRQIK